MKAEDLTKEMINEMSDAEIVFWYKQFAEQDQVAEMRKGMLNHVDVQDAKKGPRIHVDSTVVD